MKRFLIFIVVTTICLETSYSQNSFVDNDTIISWSKNRKLKWEDFKGIKDSISFTENGAVTDYSISLLPRNIKVDEYDKINAIALFFKETSWTITESLGLLKHEQIHFDIAEIYARKIRKCFSEKKENGESDIYSYIQIAKGLGNQCTVYQQLYDSETAHGTIGLKQLKWEKKVAKELKELDTYKYDAKIEDIEH
ncbi:hypothetical protein [Hwangdonia lutea]|uniref:DUF922 domain-containing protein n=1 Tax=Hwangdonia lutea TaxID=3075823 RepID=A0AA97EKH7_9FLAO|nr:hypothetical protein [Hwangdonia sp. SCSIO 19198]WOD43121.1 hypothetical protein RNZ46_14100 [Hwangdonia sp. SCSIO 19198]